MTIGEFSGRSGLSAKVLRRYAELGVLMPCVVDPASGYRYYDGRQLDDAAVVALLRRVGVPVAAIGQFLTHPSGEVLDGWERSLVAEVHARREALAEVRGRLGVSSDLGFPLLRSSGSRGEAAAAPGGAAVRMPARRHSAAWTS